MWLLKIADLPNYKFYVKKKKYNLIYFTAPVKLNNNAVQLAASGAKSAARSTASLIILEVNFNLKPTGAKSLYRGAGSDRGILPAHMSKSLCDVKPTKRGYSKSAKTQASGRGKKQHTSTQTSGGYIAASFGNQSTHCMLKSKGSCAHSFCLYVR